MDVKRCEYLLLTALDDEAAALEFALRAAHAEGPDRIRLVGTPTAFQWHLPHKLGTLRTITSSLLDMGLDAAREATRQLLTAFDAQYVGFVGIAGGATNDLAPGTVLVADQIWHYEPSKVKDSGEEHRGMKHVGGRMILDRLKYTDLGLLEKMFPANGPWTKPVVGTIASGEKVIASHERRDQLGSAGHNVIGFEMEGHSFADQVERKYGRDRWFMVRAISDSSDKSKSDEYRQLACRRAACFVIASIQDSDLCVPEEPGKAKIDAQPATREDTPNEIADQLAALLAADCPEKLIGLLAGKPIPKELTRSMAEAYWRVGDPGGCYRVTQKLAELQLSTDVWLGANEAALVRLNLWSRWRLGRIDDAIVRLEGALQRVVDVVERARWADLLGTLHRFRPNGDWLVAISHYQQAIGMKRHVNDPIGIAISFQNIAFTYIEALDFAHAREYFRRLLEFSTDSSYVGNKASQSLALLGCAWTDLMMGSPPEMARAEQHLRNAGRLLGLNEEPIPYEIRAASRCLNHLLSTRRGRARQAAQKVLRPFWARLVFGQSCVIRGRSPRDVRNELFPDAQDALLAPHRIEPLLAVVTDAQGTSVLPAGPIKPIEAPWPLSAWCGSERSTALGAIRLLEAMLEFYMCLVRVQDQTTKTQDEFVLGTARKLQSWTKKHPGHPLSREIESVASVAASVTEVRNAYVHGFPGEHRSELEEPLLCAAELTIEEAQLLRKAHWSSRKPPVFTIAGLDINLSAVCREDEAGKLVIRLGRREYREG